ncbi:MAG: MFS transporter [Candidatus Saccharimonadales bacterium]|jgi:MFS family permease
MIHITKALKILLVADSFVLVSGAMIIPFYATYVSKIGGDILEAGFAAGMFAVSAGIMTLFAGRISDRFDRKERIVAASYFVIAIGFLLYILVDSLLGLVAVQVLIGLAQASYTPAFDALYTKHLGDRKKASTAWSLWESINYFSLAIGALVGATLLHFTSFNVLFIVMSALCISSSVYLFTIRKNRL